MSHRSLTTLFAALAAVATTAIIAMAASGAGPKAHAASLYVYSYNSIGRFMTAGTHVQTVQCAPGKKLTGGGVRLHGTPGGVIVSSSPTDGIDGWRAAVLVNPAPFIDMQVQVYALCAEAP